MSASPANSKSLARGYSIAIISALILSTTAIFIRYLNLEYAMPPLAISFWRDFIVALTLFLVFRIFNPALLRIKRENVGRLFIHGMVLGVFNAIWTFSVALNGASVSTVLVYSSAVFTVLLGWWFQNEQLNWVKAVAVVLSLTGCILVSGATDPSVWGTNLVGLVTGILSGLFYAVYTLLGHSGIKKGMNSWTISFYIFGFAALFLFVFNLLPGSWFGTAFFPANVLCLGNALDGWVVLILMAVGPTLMGYGLYNLSLGYLPSSVVNLIATSEPVFTALIAFLTLGEVLDGEQIFGSVLVLAGVVILRLFEGRQSRNQRIILHEAR